MEMKAENTKRKNVHQGDNVRKFRQIMGLKQGVLAEKLGTTQQIVSLIEKKKVIEKETLIRIADILNVSPQLIEELEDSPISIVVENNNFQSGSLNSGIGCYEYNDSSTVHPLDKIIELSKENASLYERMMVIEKEKVALLENMLKEK